MKGRRMTHAGRFQHLDAWKGRRIACKDVDVYANVDVAVDVDVDLAISVTVDVTVDTAVDVAVAVAVYFRYTQKENSSSQ